jgi:hypothetical protein
MKIISESEFRDRINEVITINFAAIAECNCVTGPGRSGAIAAAYASHITRLPFIPFGKNGLKGSCTLVIDTAKESGETLKKAARKYVEYNPLVLWCYEEPPRVMFWYESQRYRDDKSILLPKKGELT